MKRSVLLRLQRTDWRVLASALGIAAVALLAWFFAPLIDVAGQAPLTTPPARLFAVAAVLALAGASLLARRALALRRNRRFLAQLAPSESGRREVAFLGKRFVQALAQLRSLRGARPGGGLRWLGTLLGRPLVHELPWYVIIGAPGAGKTTVLLNSGLHFPLADETGNESIRGVGGTRNCDWWFASEAVLIDTAGRYTTQDSDRDADRTAWLGFLDLLRRHRPRRPINGVLLAVSASDLLQATPERTAAHAAELRQRLDEISARLAIEVPVYVLVTKTDLLPGFADFFADFDQNVRAQVWGATLPSGADATQWRGEMDALEARLHEQMLERLGSERGRPRSAAIHAFPAQWRGLNRAALALMNAVAAAGGDDPPMLRGLYFTSATQDASPLQRAAGTSYFVTRLLRDVVFAESGLAGSTARGSRHRRLIERAVLAASAVVMVLALGSTWRGYERQARAVDAFAAQLPALDSALAQAQRANDLTALLPALDALAGSGIEPAHDDGLADRLLHRADMLAAAADDSYQRLLKDAFLPRIAARLEERLRKSAGEPAARTYETLRAYLMLFGGKHFDRAGLRAYFANDWNLTLPETVSAAERAALLRHLDQLLAGGEVGAPSLADAQLVAEVRARVQGVPLAQRAATRLQQQEIDAPRVALNAAAVLVRASGGALADLPPPRAAAGLAPAARRERTQQVLAALAHEQSWVLGTPRTTPAAPALADEVERLLALDNALYWQSVLDDLRLAPTPQLADSAQLARALAQADSPLLALLRTAARETAAGPSAAWFAALRAHVDGPSPPAAKMQALLGALAAHLTAADEAAKQKSMPPGSDVMRELAQAAREAPAPLNVLLTQLHTTSSNQLLGALREPLSREIARELAPACTRAVSQRYPFVRNAADDMTRDDFTRTFGTGGLFDGFVQRHLAPHADAMRSDGAAPFRRAQTIREAFFRDGGRALGTRLEFRLLELDAAAAEFTLDVDGQVLRFKRGTQQAQSIDWLTFGGSTGQSSQSGPGGRVHVLLSPSAGSGYTFNGPWALLRLLDRARVERGASPDRALISFDIEGRKARFEVRSASAHNPLLRQDLEPFQCPNKL
jgi:type VI secretion system protein ImpL